MFGLFAELQVRVNVSFRSKGKDSILLFRMQYIWVTCLHHPKSIPTHWLPLPDLIFLVVSVKLVEINLVKQIVLINNMMLGESVMKYSM